MAILNKTAIDATVSKNQEVARTKHEQLAETARLLVDQINTFTSDCTDVLDTFCYLKKNNMKVPEMRSFLNCLHEVAFDTHRFDGKMYYDITYLVHWYYQKCTFHNGKFYLSCVKYYDNTTALLDINSIHWDIEPDNYIDNCCALMTGFIKHFAEFKEKFMKYVPNA